MTYGKGVTDVDYYFVAKDAELETSVDGEQDKGEATVDGSDEVE